MLPLIMVYLGSLVLKWTYEALDVMQETQVGFRAWAYTHRLAQIKKAIVHIPLCAMWVSGGALALVNSMSAGVGLGTFEAVNVVNTVMAAWMLDTFGKPFARRLRKAENGD